MKKMNPKILALLVVTVISTVGFLSIGQAATTKKAMTVLLGQYKLLYNSQDVTTQVTPIVVNGHIYIPLQATAKLLNKNYVWSKSSLSLSDKANTSVVNLQNQIVSLQSQVAGLQNQITTKDASIQALNGNIYSLQNTINALNSSSSSSSSSSTSIATLENDLNDDYDSYEDVDFDISLSGDKNDITVSIKTDEDDWNDLTSTYQKKYLQKIVDDVLDVFNKADIDGTVKDGSSTLTEFSVSSDGDVEIDSSSEVNSLKSKLNSKIHSDYFGTLSNIDNDDLDIVLKGDTDELTYTINIDFDDYESKWDSLADAAIKAYMVKVYDYITEQGSFNDTNVIGYFYDTDGKDNLAKLYSDGNSFKRY